MMMLMMTRIFRVQTSSSTIINSSIVILILIAIIIIIIIVIIVIPIIIIALGENYLFMSAGKNPLKPSCSVPAWPRPELEELV